VHHQKGNIVAQTGPDAARAKAAADAAKAAAANAKTNAYKAGLEAQFGAKGRVKVAFDQYGNLVLQENIFMLLQMVQMLKLLMLVLL
jgi:tripartite-type tricarboxylate transporter receptor subunit TctC